MQGKNKIPVHPNNEMRANKIIPFNKAPLS